MGSDLGRPKVAAPNLAVTVTVLPSSFSMAGCQTKPVPWNASCKAALESRNLTFEPTWTLLLVGDVLPIPAGQQSMSDGRSAGGVRV